MLNARQIALHPFDLAQQSRDDSPLTTNHPDSVDATPERNRDQCDCSDSLVHRMPMRRLSRKQDTFRAGTHIPAAHCVATSAMQIGSFLGAYPLPNANTGAVFEAKRLSCHAMGTRRSRACMNHRLREAFAVAMLSASTQARGLLKFDLLLWIVVDVDSFPLLKECEAGVSHGMP